MNSATWLVEHQGATYVAKRGPPAGVDALVAGGRGGHGARRPGHRHRPAGARPRRPARPLPGGLALLEHVPGRELDGESDEEQRWIAGVLARRARGRSRRTRHGDVRRGLALRRSLRRGVARLARGRDRGGARGDEPARADVVGAAHRTRAPEAFVHNNTHRSHRRSSTGPELGGARCCTTSRRP